MLNPYEIIKRPYITEESEKDRKDLNKYSFEVDINANKLEIKEAIASLFKVKVASVNVIKIHGKTRTLRTRTGKCPDRKKAIIKLAEGQSINIFEAETK
ncbi:50S ribosomal protein L23 [Candidatus Desantisbacteria bacterium]|nr:50S ribosomal protein L23 [Candidatus Desantisbacteria bacterium]